MCKRAIVTGANGFIGYYLLKELLDSGYSVCAIARNSENLMHLYKNKKVTIISKSIEDLSVQDFTFDQYDVFFHLAWGGVNRDEIDNPEVHKKNMQLSIKCLDIARQLNCKCFLDTGSKAEYGDQTVRHVETQSCHPINAYGREKLLFFEHAQKKCQNNMRYFHVRLFSVIGKKDHPWSLISTACRKMRNNEDMTFGACQQLWNFIAVEDATKAIKKIYESSNIKKNCNEIVFNIASYDTRVLRSFIEEIRILTRSKSRLVFETDRFEEKGNFMNPSIEKLVTFTEWKPEITFSQEIYKILDLLEEGQV